jgi:phosphoribosylaminoimidazolecarboxamide formyltransferase/IMP cyclohydrolase
MESPVKRAALLSVSDRTGLVPFARVLLECGFTLLTTSGTNKVLAAEGIPTLPIEEYTGQREILDGRVKTLHPKIHGGLLAKRDATHHIAQLEEEGILPIDVAVVNLYPFTQNLSGEAAQNPAKMIELIDIGGPTMIRAAAKNFSYVLPLIDPRDYEAAGAYLKAQVARGLTVKDSAEDKAFRARLASKVFTQIANYNLQIAKYLTHVSYTEGSEGPVASADIAQQLALGPTEGFVLTKAQDLRYGENPHQKATFYSVVGREDRGWQQLNGKELSYNNLLDFDAALKLIRTIKNEQPAACIMKHLNPCGAARGATLLDALHRAKRGDPRSHFGGVLAFSQEVTLDVAKAVREDFAEIVLAPSYTAEALSYLQENKNLRVIKVSVETPATLACEVRAVEGGILIQQEDRAVSSIEQGTLVSQTAASPDQKADLAFAWSVCAHVKSNAIVLVKDQMLVGVGAGQMSRIDSVELAISKAKTHGHSLLGAVCASDAFFPFPDSVDTLAREGVKAIIAPSGAKRDSDTIASVNSSGVALIFAGDRHFRH